MIYHNEEKYHRGIKTYPAMRYSGKRDETWYESMVKADKLEEKFGLVEKWVEGLVESQQQIIFLIDQNPIISQKEMGEKIGISTTTIEKQRTHLKEQGLIRRVGSPKTGHWKLANGLVEKLGERLVDKLGERLVEKLWEGLADTQHEIIELIRENPHISKKEMAERIGISTTAIDKNIEQLKHLKLLKRVGPAKGGHWEVLTE